MKITKEEFENANLLQNDQNKFYLLSVIADSDNPLLYSDLDSYVIGRSEVGYPTWIWTKDEITEESLQKLEEDLQEFLVEGDNKITAKKELYEYLKEKMEVFDYFEMGYLSCREAIKPLKGKGIFVRPNYADKVTLAEYWRANAKEIHNNPSMTQIEAFEEVESWLEEKQFYVLKDTTGEVVSMAGYTTNGKRAKVTHVFTPKEERGKGYCQYLVYSLTKKLLEEGYTPLLYTDYNYKASNEAYKKVGYEDEGILINFKIKCNK